MKSFNFSKFAYSRTKRRSAFRDFKINIAPPCDTMLYCNHRTMSAIKELHENMKIAFQNIWHNNEKCDKDTLGAYNRRLLLLCVASLWDLGDHISPQLLALVALSNVSPLAKLNAPRPTIHSRKRVMTRCLHPCLLDCKRSIFDAIMNSFFHFVKLKNKQTNKK